MRRMVVAELFLKGGLRTQNIARICLKDPRRTPTRFTLELDGIIILQHVRLHPRTGSSRTRRSRSKVRIFGDLQPGLISKYFMSKSQIRTGRLVAEVIPTAFSLVQAVVFRLPATFNSVATDGM